MANYRAIIRHFPAARHYLQQRKWVARGDVLAYAPGWQTSAFSTDNYGFRQTWFRGQNIGLESIGEHKRVGLVLGASHLFGFGLAGNDETLPSQLARMLGHPVFGVAFPEADTRALYSTLLRVLQQYPGRVGEVVLLTGGDFTRYCYTGKADPLFGPPLARISASEAVTDAQTQLTNLMYFSSFWTAACAELATRSGARFYLAEDYTFFEKTIADPTETACNLGTPRNDRQSRRFAAHRAHVVEFGMERRRLADALKLPLIRFPEADELLFIDEFHYRAETQTRIAERLAMHLA